MRYELRTCVYAIRVRCAMDNVICIRLIDFMRVELSVRVYANVEAETGAPVIVRDYTFM